MAPEPATVAAGPQVVVRPIGQSDVESIARWYPKAVVLAGSSAPLGDQLDSRGRLLVLTEGGDHQPAGLVLVALDDPEPGWASVSLLAIAAAEHRDLAAQAVALLDADLQQEATYIRAALPADAGPALYFWLRLGYRPSVSGARLWMVRDLDT